ncbi:hypothetical protein AX16_008788 [Volvariella volvacea WC 439]|nr:hypothetical protein AX16_008788 [Volvariella volvacea WC 439]
MFSLSSEFEFLSDPLDMARSPQQPQLRKSSPYRPLSRFQRSSPKSVLWATRKPWPSNIKLGEPKRRTGATWSSNNIADGKADGHPQPIISTERNHQIGSSILPRHAINFHDYREHHGADEARNEQDDSVSLDDDRDLFYWEEETTLFSDLMDEVVEDEDAKLTALTLDLQRSFDIHGTDLKKEIAEAFVPIVNGIKEVYRRLENEVDYKYESALIAFDKTSKQAEVMALHERDEISGAYRQGQNKLKSLMVELEETYANRDQLWSEYETNLTGIANPMLEILRELPATIEGSITNMERQCRQLEKEDANTAAEKKLKALLARA